MDKTTFITKLKEARAAWDALLAQLSEEQMLQVGVTDRWSVKDLIAHIAWNELEMIPLMRAHTLAGGSELWNLSQDERNEAVYQQNRDRPLADTLEEEQQAYADLFAAAQALSDEDLNDPGRYEQMPAEWVPWRIFAGCSFKHYQDHLLALRDWLEQKEREQ